MRRCSIGFAIIAISGIGAIIPGTVKAHPHVWADSSFHIQMAQNLDIQSLKVSWLFDELYSSFVVGELAVSDTEEGLQSIRLQLSELAKSHVLSLADYDYFTELSVAGQDVELPIPYQFVGNWRDGQYELVMEFDLKDMKLSGKNTMTVQSYDPSFYIDIVPNQSDALSIDGMDAFHCDHEIEIPEDNIATAEQLSDANFLDSFNQQGGIGLLFSRPIHIQCVEKNV